MLENQQRKAAKVHTFSLTQKIHYQDTTTLLSVYALAKLRSLNESEVEQRNSRQDPRGPQAPPALPSWSFCTLCQGCLDARSQGLCGYCWRDGAPVALTASQVPLRGVGVSLPGMPFLCPIVQIIGAQTGRTC